MIGQEFMKSLFLMRHAESPNSIINDFERIVTPKGIEKSKEVGKILANYKLDRIFSSDSIRTKQTVEAIVIAITLQKLEGARSEVYKKYISDEITHQILNCDSYTSLNSSPIIEYHHFLYHISVENLLTFIQDSLLEHDNILIVNHNPVISQLISFLLQNDKNSAAYDVAIGGIPPASLFHFENDKLANFWL